MAATRLIPMHINKGKTIAKCINKRINYSINPDKTNAGEWVSTYACDIKTIDEEFLLSKRQYLQKTGRSPKNDIIAYQIRQSFKPGEVTPELANKIGYELAMRFTKSNHAFVVATHIDRAHIHNHIIFNSTTLDCEKKFRNLFLSSFVIQKISDLLCLENGLSVIEATPYRDRTKRKNIYDKESFRQVLCNDIDDVLKEKPKDFDEFISCLCEKGYEFKDGKYPAVKGKNQKRYIRFRSLKEGYQIEDIKIRLLRNKTNKISQSEKQFDLLIDIQEKIKLGKSNNYIYWAKKFNLKQMAKALLFLQEQDIHNMETLVFKTEEVTKKYYELSNSIKEAESRLKEIGALKMHIINYSKTRQIYIEYQKSGYSKSFFEEHSEQLLLHKAAKDHFNELKLKQIPKVKELSEEYAVVLEKKKKAYSQLRELRHELKEYQLAKRIITDFMKDENQVERTNEKRER